MSSISGSEKKLLGPYLDLSYKLGTFAGQLTENAIKAICKRSELMSKLPGGVMLSVAMEEEALLKKLKN